MTSTTQRSAALDDALFELSLASDLNSEVLDEVIRRFPDHAAEVTEFAIDLALIRLRTSSAEDDIMPTDKVSPAVSRALSAFQNHMHTLQSREVSLRPLSPTSASPFQDLTKEGFRSLAKKLDVNTLFLTKVIERMIIPDTIGEPFRNLIAGEINIPRTTLDSYLASSPSIAHGASFKSEGKPELTPRQSFDDAVRTSQLSPEQQSRLLKLR